MAILKKRQSKASLPEVTTDKGVIINKPKETETSTATPKIAKKTAGESPSAKLTSVIKSGPPTTVGSGTTGDQTTTGAKPTVSAKVGTAKPTITTQLSGVARPTVQKVKAIPHHPAH
jgi:hypothetical protein